MAELTDTIRQTQLLAALFSPAFPIGAFSYSHGIEAAIASGDVEINRGLSRERLSEFSDEYLDWIYIDTDHSYLTTKDELLIASSKVKRGGYIAGHDFTSGNPVKALPYGVIQACNEFCVKEGWGYEFLTLEPSGHSSFALKKIVR